MVYLLKTIICLGLIYCFYQIFLRDRKILAYNRYFLIFSVLFSVLIPLLKIRFQTDIPLNFDRLFLTNNPVPTEPAIPAGSLPDTGRSPNLLWMGYWLIVLVMLIRFVTNLYRLLRLISTNKTHSMDGFTWVLIEEKTLPYSFFRYIFVNRSEYESGVVEPELLLHERAHGRQLHSLDILLIELARIAFWFNPFIWLLGREVQLIHEYLADQAVLKHQNTTTYQKKLLNVVFRNQSTYLASNFTYSFTKKRLIMMQKEHSRFNVFRKILTVPLVALLSLLLVQAQSKPEKTPTPAKRTVKYTAPKIVNTKSAKPVKRTVKFTPPVILDEVKPKTTKPAKRTIKFTPPHITPSENIKNEEQSKTPVQIDVKDVPPPPPDISKLKKVTTADEVKDVTPPPPPPADATKAP